MGFDRIETGYWLTFYKDTKSLLDTEWLNLEQLAQLGWDELQSYCGPWHKVSLFLGLFVDYYEGNLKGTDPDRLELSENIAFKIYPLVKKLSPLLCEVPWQLDFVYKAIHPRYKSTHWKFLDYEAGQRQSGGELLRMMREGLVNVDISQIDRSTIKAIREIILKSKVFVIGDVPRSVCDEFRFTDGQVFFNEKRIAMPTGRPQDILRTIINAYPETATYQLLEKTDMKFYSARGQLRKDMSILSKALKSNSVPFEIISVRNCGYSLIPIPE